MNSTALQNATNHVLSTMQNFVSEAGNLYNQTIPTIQNKTDQLYNEFCPNFETAIDCAQDFFSTKTITNNPVAVAVTVGTISALALAYACSSKKASAKV